MLLFQESKLAVKASLQVGLVTVQVDKFSALLVAAKPVL